MSTLDITSFMIKSSKEAKSKVRQYTPSTFIYWSRFGMGILAALICYGLQLKGSTGLSFAILLYLISLIVVRRLYHAEKEFQTGHKIVILGLGTYIFTWATLWIFLYTINPY